MFVRRVGLVCSGVLSIIYFTFPQYTSFVPLRCHHLIFTSDLKQRGKENKYTQKDNKTYFDDSSNMRRAFVLFLKTLLFSMHAYVKKRKKKKTSEKHRGGIVLQAT